MNIVPVRIHPTAPLVAIRDDPDSANPWNVNNVLSYSDAEVEGWTPLVPAPTASDDPDAWVPYVQLISGVRDAEQARELLADKPAAVQINAPLALIQCS